MVRSSPLFSMNFNYYRTVRLEDTDAAGVVFFAKLLSICHEAYEESLLLAGIDLKKFFRDSNTAVPIVKANISFFRPLFAGDKLLINLKPQLLKDSEFEIAYAIFLAQSDRESAAIANTKHVCIDPTARVRQDLPAALLNWLES